MSHSPHISRAASRPGEPVGLRREGPSRYWHARDASGALVGQDKYRHDLSDRLAAAGFEVAIRDRQAAP